MPDTPAQVAAYLSEVRQREQAATTGPWWTDENELMWRLHGVAFKIPPQIDGLIPEQVVNKQIVKAPKSGTPYAEYWPDAADEAFIVAARSDVPRLLGAVEAALARHVAVPSARLVPCEAHKRWHGALAGVPEFGQEFETENLRVRRACPACQVFDEPYCRNCLNDDGGCQDWPCVEHRAITKALLGTDKANG